MLYLETAEASWFVSSAYDALDETGEVLLIGGKASITAFTRSYNRKPRWVWFIQKHFGRQMIASARACSAINARLYLQSFVHAEKMSLVHKQKVARTCVIQIRGRVAHTPTCRGVRPPGDNPR